MNGWLGHRRILARPVEVVAILRDAYCDAANGSRMPGLAQQAHRRSQQA
jgi:hypothetical protein